MKKALFTVTIIALIAAFCVSGYMVFNYLKDGKEQKELNESLSNIVANAQTQAQETADETVDPEETTNPEPVRETVTVRDENGMLLAYKEIYEMNSDTVGWIRIAGTVLDYPVMQTPDVENYYLYKNFNKEDSARGSIYVREVCDVDEPSDNITIYGHNMKDGSMFACLHEYINKETWENNNLIFFDTLKEYHTYEIFAVFKTSANIGEGFSYHKFVDAKDEAAFDKFVKTCKDLAFYDTGITPEYGDKLITLSTCEYTLGDNGRLVVVARRIS